MADWREVVGIVLKHVRQPDVWSAIVVQLKKQGVTVTPDIVLYFNLLDGKIHSWKKVPDGIISDSYKFGHQCNRINLKEPIIISSPEVDAALGKVTYDSLPLTLRYGTDPWIDLIHP